jgi:hypothetical protein
MKKELVFALSITTLLAGCNSASSYSEGSGSASASSSAGFMNTNNASFKGLYGAAHLEGHRLASENGRLTLNDQYYGMVKENDESALLMDQGKPKVLVNKIERLKAKSE